MRSFLVSVICILVMMMPPGTLALSVRRLQNKNNIRITDKKTDMMFQSQRQKQVNPPTHPGAVHHTHRVELPGKHRQGPWFNIKSNKMGSKASSSSKKKSRGGGTPPGRGRTWSYGRVPWW
mmetsp:Transcript_2798/g.3382  ORF Transcript_2798/g.3382 Transcript_2798/m.3382 type:complete len:121 (+) Transcript_2798:145-507(+)|eukprot:CAMPEP_0195264792 /NCGR_PEP_ID=MMETSP0706-20130129/11059_1 /TAXON_ID=33640 /ORGANISM="Asterionellopsis glacialis, Strain CCMP134" /LENGTH=120 /DNA_ID=CAMNT_0040319127 /DNA_START=113 /DNA_END=475 /DNA_ORIENTATION=+